MNLDAGTRPATSAVDSISATASYSRFDSLQLIDDAPIFTPEFRNSAVTLREEERFQSGLRQTFTVPAGVTALQFEIVDLDLAENDGGPDDAFEVALLDAATGQSLVGTATPLANTDSLLNLQHDTSVYFANSVRLPNVGLSGVDKLPAVPTIVTVDLSSVPAGTAATLYFDLLGFGDAESSVTIDNVRLISGDVPDLSFMLDAASDSAVDR